MSLQNKLLYLSQTKDLIRSAIESKGVSVGEVEFRAYPAKILSIPTGGPERPQVGAIRVRFTHIDPNTGEYITTVRKCEKGGVVTPPEVSDISGVKGYCPNLAFQGWTHETFEKLQSNLDVGAMYVPSDGWSYFYLNATKMTGTDEIDALSNIAYFQKSAEGVLVFRIEKLNGDLVYETTAQDAGNATFPFTLPEIGQYVVGVRNMGGTFAVGQGTTASVCVGGNVAAKKSMLTRVFLGSGVSAVTNYGFYQTNSVELLSLPYGLTSLGSQAYETHQARKVLILPAGVTALGANLNNTAYGCSNIVIPEGVTSIPSNGFATNYSLREIVFPSSLSSIGAGAFTNCFGMRLYDLSRVSAVPTLANISAFTGINQTCRFNVPAALLEAFQGATNWSTYAKYIYPND